MSYAKSLQRLLKKVDQKQHYCALELTELEISVSVQNNIVELGTQKIPLREKVFLGPIICSD